MRSTGRGIGRQRVGFALVFALVLAGLVTVGHATTAPPDVAVSISGFAYHGPNGDGTFTIPIGTRVTWTNNDGFPHTTTSDATPTPVWDSGSIAGGGSFSFTFTQTGVFPYHCTIHPFIAAMHGTITVTGTPPNPTSVLPTTGASAGGTHVTITGTNFQPGATVTFGGVAATNANVTDATTIIATTPAHPAGTFDIVVTNPDSTAGTLSPGFTFVVINPLPPLKPSIAPLPGVNPLPPAQPPSAPDPGHPSPLPGGRPPGNVPAQSGSVPAPAPLPFPTRR
ncbi:MAG: IPT/TIG domain-containing protein [Thermomicrobiales bacterium]